MMHYKIDYNLTEKLFWGKYEFHIAKKIRKKYDLNTDLFSLTGNIVFQNINVVRALVYNVNKTRADEKKLTNGEVYGAGLLDEIYHFILREYEAEINPNVFSKALNHLNEKIGEDKVRNIIFRFVEIFPPLEVFLGKASAFDYLNSYTENRNNIDIALEELMLLYFANFNPANNKLKEFFNEDYLGEKKLYIEIIGELNKFFLTQQPFGPDNQDIFSMLITPIINNPNSLWDQLDFISEKWRVILREFLINKIMTSKDIMKEENNFESFGGGDVPSVVPVYKGLIFDADNLVLGKSLHKYALDAEKDIHEPEKFTKDIHWMPQVVMIAKNIYVWLDQLSKKYQREIKTLNQIPDEELDLLAKWNFNALWLIGIWARSEASKRIKHIMGNNDAVASAYSLYDYVIASDLGGEEAYANLNFRAKERGIRLASDMVPNHTGIFSDWVIQHPENFIHTKNCPFPNYKFTGENLSKDNNIEIRIEDGYFTKSDAAVVFQRIDKRTNDITYIYHGNDGTNMPWNDTAQLNMLEGYVREAVIQKIFEVARKFSIIRFDAAMTLTKRHFSRLWYPQPGKGGDIPSRTDFSLSGNDFDSKFPVEFWREVVDRINNELPDTLLLAEAFWLMEGYFVRTLGMHRVYNSAFMHMLMKEENEKYRDLITNTLEYEPEILKRYVNFMSNPDEETAIRQFGTDDKYFGVLAMMVCLPGLPMFAHGQIEGYTEKYGMEYQRSYYNELPKEWLIERHNYEVFPIMKKRYLFAEVMNFWFYDLVDVYGNINENVFAFTNSYGNEKTFVLFNNKYDRAEGKLFGSTLKLISGIDKKYLAKKSLIETLNIKNDESIFYVLFDEISKKHFIYNYNDFQEGLYIELNGFEHRVFVGIAEVHDSQGIFNAIHEQFRNIPINNIDALIDEIRLAPIHNAYKNILERQDLEQLKKCLIQCPEKLEYSSIDKIMNKYNLFVNTVNEFANRKIDINSSLKKFNSFLRTIQKLNLSLKSLNIDEEGITKFDAKSILLSEQANYNENLFLILLIEALLCIETESKIVYEIIDKFKLDKAIKELLIMLGRGEFGVEREHALVYVIFDFYNQLDKLNESPNIQFPEQKTYEKFMFAFVVSSIKKSYSAKFLLINEYQNAVYFSKERFVEYSDWLTTIILLKVWKQNRLLTERKFEMEVILALANKLNRRLKYIAEKSDYKLESLINEFTIEFKKESGNI